MSRIHEALRKADQGYAAGRGTSLEAPTAAYRPATAATRCTGDHGPDDDGAARSRQLRETDRSSLGSASWRP